jgi:hypothetical protein
MTKTPISLRAGRGFLPAIYHEDRTAEYTKWERFPRKVKATAIEAIDYAEKRSIGREWWIDQASKMHKS